MPVSQAIPYTYGEWSLRETHERLRAMALGDPTQLVVASIGDSWTQFYGYYAGPVMRSLQAAYGDAGTGWTGLGFAGPGGAYLNGTAAYPASSVSGWSNPDDWGFAQYDSAPSPDLAASDSAVAGARITVSNGPSGCSSVRLLALGTDAGRIRYRWNGGEWAEASVAGTGHLAIRLANVPGAAWVLDLEGVSGTVNLAGLDVQKSGKGVRLHKLGGTGSRASQWVAVDAAQWQAGLAALDPRLVTVLLGTNDQAIYDPTTFKVHVQELITRVRAAVPAADILLIAPPENQLARQWPMKDYARALLELAQANDCAFLDLQPVFGEVPADYAAGSARPWFDPDGVHPAIETGGRAITDAILRLLVPPI